MHCQCVSPGTRELLDQTGIGLVAGTAALPDGLLFTHRPDTGLWPDGGRRLTEALEETAG